MEIILNPRYTQRTEKANKIVENSTKIWIHSTNGLEEFSGVFATEKDAAVHFDRYLKLRYAHRKFQILVYKEKKWIASKIKINNKINKRS